MNKREVGPATTTVAAPADPPLPAGWDTVVTEDGEQYFHFPSTGETTTQEHSLGERPTVDAAAATVGGAVLSVFEPVGSVSTQLGLRRYLIPVSLTVV